MSMLSYIAKRLIALVPVLFGVLTLTFILSKLMPGDPVRLLLPRNAPPGAYEALKKALGFDKPIIVQYFRYIGDLFTGNWGTSISINPGEDVWEIIWAIIIILLAFAIIRPKFSNKCANKDWDSLYNWFLNLGGIKIPWMLIWGIIIEAFSWYWWGGLPILIPALVLIFAGPKPYEWKA